MISISDKIKQISGFSNSDSKVVKDSILSLSTAMWIMNILMSTNFTIGLTKRDQKLFDHAKETLITEMKRLKYNLSDYKVLPVSKKNEPVLLKIKLEQRSDQIIDVVNANLDVLSKDGLMVIEALYAHLMNNNSGVCITISDLHDKTALQVIDILNNLSQELKVSNFSDVLDVYSRPTNQDNAKIIFNLVNPWALSMDQKNVLCIAAPIFNEYNSPFKLIALLQNIIYLINQKCIKETDVLFDSLNLPKFQNKLFGQSFFYII